MKRRVFLSTILGALAAPAFAQAQIGQDFESDLLPLPKRELMEPKQMNISRPWGQVLRTFGDPVLEGHFSVRVNVPKGNLCVAMWDRGDRVLGFYQTDKMDSFQLWTLVRAILGRRPDVNIDARDYSFTEGHYETAHWRLDERTGESLNRKEDARAAKALSWPDPSYDIARAVRPLFVRLSPPSSKYTHVLWTEPTPLVPGGPASERGLILGKGRHPEIEKALMMAVQTERMLIPLENTAAATDFVNDTKPFVPFTATLTNVFLPNGTLWGRCRVLTI